MYQKFIKRTLLGALSLLLCWAVMIGVIDPFFHYHKPWFGMEPLVEDERYQNPGIAAHFPYDAMIMGSSMAENFRTGWFDRAFDCSSVKLTFSAARTGAYDWMMKKGFAAREIEKVFIGLDNDSLVTDHGSYMFPLPEYLYDGDPFNDVEYLCNLDVLEPAAELVKKNIRGTVPPLEEAYVWDEPGLCNQEAALASVTWDMLRQQGNETDRSRYLKNCRENLEKDLLPHIQAHPETEFYIFFPPYSVLWWNRMWNKCQLEERLEVTGLAMDLLLPCENVRLYFFQDMEEVVCDLENYKDYNHYSAEISREMVNWLKEGRGLVTPENRESLLSHMRELTLQYDYAALLS